MIWSLILLPFLIQSIAIGIDECYFHLKRGLPRWERIGHPLDTLSLLLCLFFVLFVPFSAGALKLYVGLAVLSCLMVTKDEFVHKHCCPAAEQWLHALLFLNHPIILASMGIMWPILCHADLPVWLLWLNQPQALRGFLVSQGVLISGFFFYQVIYWNFIWKETK